MVDVGSDDVVILLGDCRFTVNSFLLSNDPEIGLTNEGYDEFDPRHFGEFGLEVFDGIDVVGDLLELELHLENLVIGGSVEERRFGEVVKDVACVEPELLDPLGRLPLNFVEGCHESEQSE